MARADFDIYDRVQTKLFNDLITSLAVFAPSTVARRVPPKFWRNLVSWLIGFVLRDTYTSKSVWISSTANAIFQVSIGTGIINQVLNRRKLWIWFLKISNFSFTNMFYILSSGSVMYLPLHKSIIPFRFRLWKNCAIESAIFRYYLDTIRAW